MAADWPVVRWHAARSTWLLWLQCHFCQEVVDLSVTEERVSGYAQRFGAWQRVL